MGAALLPEDGEYLVQSMAQECADLSYAARVGIAAVILNRVEDSRFPDTAAGVIASWDKFDIRSTVVVDEREYRLCADAYSIAAYGADPTGGALYFEFLDDDAAADYSKYSAIISGVGFW